MKLIRVKTSALPSCGTGDSPGRAYSTSRLRAESVLDTSAMTKARTQGTPALRFSANMPPIVVQSEHPLDEAMYALGHDVRCQCSNHPELSDAQRRAALLQLGEKCRDGDGV